MEALQLDVTHLVALAAALGWASGMRLYAVVFLTGAAGYMGWLPLPPGLHLLQQPVVMVVSFLFFVLEFVADKIPGVDTLWDTVHTFIRIPAGAALAAAVVGDHSGALQLAMGVMGGSLAAGTHFAKAGARAAINTSPEPFSNVAASLGEDALFAGGMWTLLAHPLWFLGGLAVFLVLAGLVIATMWRFIRRVLRPRARAADTG